MVARNPQWNAKSADYLASAQVSLVNARGEQFAPGDHVAALPDHANAEKHHGRVEAVLFAGFHVLVEWDDYTTESHIDRITHRRKA